MNIRQWELLICWWLWYYMATSFQGLGWLPSLISLNPENAFWGLGELFFFEASLLACSFGLIAIHIKKCLATILLCISKCFFILMYYHLWNEYPQRDGYFYSNYNLFRPILNVFEIVVLIVGFPGYGMDRKAKRLWNRVFNFISPGYVNFTDGKK